MGASAAGIKKAPDLSAGLRFRAMQTRYRRARTEAPLGLAVFVVRLSMVVMV